MFFMRNSPPGTEVSDSKFHEDVSFGTMPQLAMEGLQAVLTHLYLPIATAESKGWKVAVGIEVRAT